MQHDRAEQQQQQQEQQQQQQQQHGLLMNAIAHQNNCRSGGGINYCSGGSINSSNMVYLSMPIADTIYRSGCQNVISAHQG